MPKQYIQGTIDGIIAESDEVKSGCVLYPKFFLGVVCPKSRNLPQAIKRGNSMKEKKLQKPQERNGRARKAKCPYCKVTLVKEKDRSKCPRCQYYERPVYGHVRLVKTYRQERETMMNVQKDIFNRLKKQQEKEQKRLLN